MPFSISERRITSSHQKKGISLHEHPRNKSKPNKIYRKCSAHSRKTNHRNTRRANKLQNQTKRCSLPRNSYQQPRISAIRILAKMANESRRLLDLSTKKSKNQIMIGLPFCRQAPAGTPATSDNRHASLIETDW